MAREVDTRDYAFRVAVPTELTAELSTAFEDSPALPSKMSEIDPFTGSIRRLELHKLNWRKGSRRRLALEIARNASASVAGFTEGEVPEFGLSAEIQQTAAETEVVHLQQHHLGIPVFQAIRTVQFRAGDKASLTGSTVENLGEVETELRVSAVEAVQVAARHVATPDDNETEESGYGDPMPPPSLDIAAFDPRILTTFDLPMQPTVLLGNPFEGPIRAHLVYFYQGPRLRLGWHVVLVFPGRAADYAVVVAAAEEKPGEVLYARNRVCSMLGECEVHPHNPGETPKRMTPFPPALADLPQMLRASPGNRDWLEGADASGNNVAVKDGQGARLAGSIQSQIVRFRPASAREDALAHTFYFCNIMHDFFEALGFDAAAGNFQTVNADGEPGAGDGVEAVVFDEAVTGVATMQTPPDGQPPLMRMGLFTDTNRHTGFDSDVVFHEFVHGVSNRLVGGRLDDGSLVEPQSRGMGEGWSDYFALTYQNSLRPTDKNVTGDWLTGRPGGIRGFPYDDDFPDGFGSLATGRYRGSVHARGEIWCATLMRATRGLAETLGDKGRGYAIAWQAVVDGLKLTAANPSFLDARDAILDAIEDLGTSGAITAAEETEARRAFWRSFAHSGMGVGASSLGPTLINIVPDHQLPPDL